jgi:hypothetical protein
VIYLTFHRNRLRIRSRRQRLAGYRRLHRATRCEHLQRNRELKVYRLFTRGRRSAFASKTSSPNTSTWLEFASQAAIFMGPVGAILLGDGSRWGFVLALTTQPFWFYTSFRHRQYFLCLRLGNRCVPEFLRVLRPFEGDPARSTILPDYWVGCSVTSRSGWRAPGSSNSSNTPIFTSGPGSHCSHIGSNVSSDQFQSSHQLPRRHGRGLPEGW